MEIVELKAVAIQQSGLIMTKEQWQEIQILQTRLNERLLNGRLNRRLNGRLNVRMQGRTQGGGGGGVFRGFR